jgi:1,4-alpha-glucan branching enzyme
VGAQGAFTFVLHSHLPYARLAGRWPHGEEWIHEAASETYIPLLNALYDLKERGIPYKLTLGITPTLAEQLTDPLVLAHFDEYLEMRLAAAQKDMEVFAPSNGQLKSYGNPYEAINQDEHAVQRKIAEMAVYEPIPLEIVEPTQPHLAALAKWYYDWYSAVKRLFNERFGRDIIGAFRQLQDEGTIEIIASAATHGYLPLLSRDSSIIAQLKVGIQSYERLFGKRPTGMWLPECAYRPAYEDEAGRLRPGIEHFLAQEGIKVFFVETHTITGGQPVGVANGDVIGPYGAVKRRYVIPASPNPIPERSATTFEAYNVSDSGNTQEGSSGVAAIGRNNDTGHQVWSAQIGYPGDFDYREFHKKAGTSGLQYWRVTGDRVDLASKDLYHPDWAAMKVDQHAEHFAHMVGDLIREYHEKTGRYGILASNYDTELFGHWWFEGMDWLAKVIQHLAASPEIDMVTASEYVTKHAPETTLHLPESSWGAGGTHFTWDNGETHWMWQPIHECEGIMEDLVVRFGSPTAAEEIVLKQAARELLLLQSSDWSFLVTTGQAREYAIQRFSQHVERFRQLADSLLAGKADVELATNLYELDKVFPDIDYRWFVPA